MCSCASLNGGDYEDYAVSRKSYYTLHLYRQLTNANCHKCIGMVYSYRRKQAIEFDFEADSNSFSRTWRVTVARAAFKFFYITLFDGSRSRKDNIPLN